MTAGFPAAAARLRTARVTLAADALRIAVSLDPTLQERYDERGLRQLLADYDGFVERLAQAISANEPAVFKEFADMSAPVFRRRRVPMDDLVTLLEGLRRAVAAVLAPDELASADLALDAGIQAYHYWRRFAGDARRRNPLLQMLYRGG
jgi:hypothetical protein